MAAPEHPMWYYGWYYGWSLLGAVSCSSLLITIWVSSLVKRHPVNQSLLLSFVVSNICQILLLLAGRFRAQEPPPPHGLCLFQGMVMLAFPALSSFAALALIYRIFTLVYAMAKNTQPPTSTLSTFCLISIPWIGFLVLILANMGVGIRKPEVVMRQTFYCTINDNTLSMVNLLITAGVIAIGVFFTVFIGYLLYTISKSGDQKTTSHRGDYAYIFRIFPFTFYMFIDGIVAGVFSNNFAAVIPDLFVVTTGFFCFIIFASQTDVLYAWFRHPRLLFHQSNSHSASRSGGRAVGQGASQPTKHDRSISIPERNRTLPPELPFSFIDFGESHGNEEDSLILARIAGNHLHPVFLAERGEIRREPPSDTLTISKTTPSSSQEGV